MKFVIFPRARSFRLFSNNGQKRRPSIFILCSLLIAAFLQPAAGQLTDSGQSDSIRGTVINSITREPVGRALVYSPDNRFATMTDSEGRFEFALPKSTAPESSTGGVGQTVALLPGVNRPYMLMARKPGFLETNPGEQTAQSSSSNDVTLTLVPEALIIGRVSLPSAEGAERVQVELYRRAVREGRAHWIPAGSATTRSNGEFRFPELPAGSYKLLTRELLDRDPLTFDPRGQLFGYPPIYYPAAADFSAAGVIQLEAGKTFQADLSVVRQPYYPIKVAVADVPPGVGVSVVVSAQGRRGPGFALGYNQQDQMIEGMLPNGSYTLEATTFGQVTASGLLSVTVRGGPLEGPRMVLVRDPQINVNVREEFTSSEQSNPAGVVGSVSVRGGGQASVSNLNVMLQPVDDFGQERGAMLQPSTKDHSLVLGNVQPGRYWPRFDSSRGYVASATCAGVDLLHHPLVVAPGASPPPIEVTTRDDSAEISGTVEEVASSRRSQNSGSFGIASGDTILRPYSPGAHVYLVPLPDGPGQFREAWIAEDGSFTSPPLAPGSYRVLAFDRAVEELEYHNPEAMRAYDSKAPLVRVVAGQKEHLQLHLISTGD